MFIVASLFFLMEIFTNTNSNGNDKQNNLSFIISAVNHQTPCYKEWWNYNKPHDGIYHLCHDASGWKLKLPNGSNHSWGNGYSKKDVMSRYNLTESMFLKGGKNSRNCTCN